MYIGVPAMMPGLRYAGVVGRPGQAEVGDLDVRGGPASSRILAGLMSRWISPGAVGGGQAAGDLPADPEHVRDLQRPGPIELLLQGFSGDVLHDQVGDR